MKRITSLFVSFILIYITASLIAGVLMGIILIIFKLDPKAMADSIGIFHLVLYVDGLAIRIAIPYEKTDAYISSKARI